jgi:hypothetical protein
MTDVVRRGPLESRDFRPFHAGARPATTHDIRAFVQVGRVDGLVVEARQDFLSRQQKGGVVDRGWLIFWAIVAALIVSGGYVVACAIYPFANCRRCHGSGRKRSPSGRAWRLCRKCKGSGARVRLGRRIWTKVVAAKKAAVD